MTTFQLAFAELSNDELVTCYISRTPTSKTTGQFGKSPIIRFHVNSSNAKTSKSKSLIVNFDKH